MFALLNPPRGAHKRKRRKKASAVAPLSPSRFVSRYSRLRNKSTGAAIMHRRPIRKNFGQNMSVPKPQGVFSGFKVQNLNGMIPILAGAVAQHVVTGIASRFIPMTKSGAGSIVLGLLSAGGLGVLAEKASPNFAEGAFLGAMTLTGVKALAAVATQGVGALGLKGLDDRFDSHLDGLGDFADPLKINNSLPTANTMSQYSLPSPNAVMQPMDDYVIQAGPNLHHQSMQQAPQHQPQAQGVADYQDQAVQQMMHGLESGVGL